MKLRALALAGVVWFAITLAALEYSHNGRVTWLAIHSLAVAVSVVLLSTLVRPSRAAARVRPSSKWFPAALFVILTSHFLDAIGDETLRSLRAWRSAAGSPRTLRARVTAARSLGHALAGILKRSLTRAERVYAALAISGVAR
jgi:hypothetical protein